MRKTDFRKDATGRTALCSATLTAAIACVSGMAEACDPGWSQFYDYNASSHYAVRQYQGQAYRGGWFSLSRWTGNQWEIFGGGIHGDLVDLHADALLEMEMTTDRGRETVLVVGGKFPYAGDTYVRNLAIWNNEEFQPLGGGTDRTVEALCVYNGELIVGGAFDYAGNVAVNHIARWDGERWHPLAGGVYDAIPGEADGVTAMTVYHGDLYVVGDFSHADGKLVNYVARWDGKEWSDVGGGVELVGYEFTGLRDVAVHDDKLVVAGAFDYAGDTAAVNIAAWDGTEWEAFGAGGDPYDDVFQWRQALLSVGSYNGLLYAGGDFSDTAGPNAEAIAVWDGQSWSEVDGGVVGGSFFLTLVMDFAPYVDDDVESLLIGGDFDHAGGELTDSVALWTTCPVAGDVTFDEIVDINDVFAVLAAWGPCEVCIEDVNGDGFIDIDDLFAVLANWT